MSSILVIIISFAVIWVVFYIFATTINLVKYTRIQREVTELDQQIFAFESGADDVTMTPRDRWLENIIIFNGLGSRPSYLPKDVLLEKHDLYKSCFFVYAPQFLFRLKAFNCLLIQFRTVSNPHFVVSKAKPRFPEARSWSRLALNQQGVDFPKNLHVYGAFRDELEVLKFWREHPELKFIFKLPDWREMWVKHGFIALYFDSDQKRQLDLTRQMYGLDEKIARILLGEQLGALDPADDIRLVKDVESQ